MPDKGTQERLLTPAEIVTRLRVSLVTVGRWLRERKFTRGESWPSMAGARKRLGGVFKRLR